MKRQDFNEYTRFQWPRDALSHKVWDKFPFKKGMSGREMMVGTVYKGLELIDKIIMPINSCPRCNKNTRWNGDRGGHSTFHKWVQFRKDAVDNVYSTKVIGTKKGYVFFKFDYCFDCQQEFLIEAFMWKKVKKK